MGLCCSKICDDEDPARQPLINRGSTWHEPPPVPVLRQSYRTRPPTPFSNRATLSHSAICTAPKRSPRPKNVASDGTTYSVPQPTSVRSSITTKKPEREPLINGTSGGRACKSTHVFAQPVVKQTPKPAQPSCAYGTFLTSSKDVNPVINHWPPKRVYCNKELLVELLHSFQTHHLPIVPKFSAYELESLDRKSAGFVRKSLFRNRRFQKIYEICGMKRVWNPYLMLQYMLNRCKYEYKLKEYHMYHGTDLVAAHCIMEQNFNWRMVKEFTCGKGVYFANNPYLASHYGKKRNKGATDYYIMIVAKVLIEEGDIERGFAHVIAPPGHSTTSKSKQEIIKFDDCLFYPEFLVYYKPIGNKI